MTDGQRDTQVAASGAASQFFAVPEETEKSLWFHWLVCLLPKRDKCLPTVELAVGVMRLLQRQGIFPPWEQPPPFSSLECRALGM